MVRNKLNLNILSITYGIDFYPGFICFLTNRELLARNRSLDGSENFGFTTSPAVSGFVDLS